MNNHAGYWACIIEFAFGVFKTVAFGLTACICP